MQEGFAQDHRRTSWVSETSMFFEYCWPSIFRHFSSILYPGGCVFLSQLGRGCFPDADERTITRRALPRYKRLLHAAILNTLKKRTNHLVDNNPLPTFLLHQNQFRRHRLHLLRPQLRPRSQLSLRYLMFQSCRRWSRPPVRPPVPHRERSHGAPGIPSPGTVRVPPRTPNGDQQ